MSRTSAIRHPISRPADRPADCRLLPFKPVKNPHLPHVRVPPVLVHRQDAYLEQVRPQQPAAAAAGLRTHGRRQPPSRLGMGIPQGHTDPSLGLGELD
jgi:hypothetical protein